MSLRLCSSRCVSTAILIATTAAFCVFSPVLAGNGFPGKGDPSAWSDALPYYNLANRYLNTQRYDQAVEKYNEAIARYQYDPDFYINLGVACGRLNDTAGAENALKKALELNPKDWMSWSNLAGIYVKQDRWDDTLNAYEKALLCNPPAAEKSKIQKDIADLRKLLSMRSGGKTGNEPTKADTNADSPSKRKQLPKPITTGTPVRSATGSGASQADKARLEQQTKSSGWDWIDK